MLKVPPIPFIRRRRARRSPTQAPAALVLQAAEMINFEPPVLRVRFDRAIDVSAIDVGQITVNYPSGPGFEYVGEEVTGAPDPETFELAMTELGSATGSQDVLNATGATGIVAVDDGGTWPGVTELLLPYP